MTAIDYYFTPVSPFSYLGHERLGVIARRHGAAIRLKPVDLVRIFAASGGLPLPKRSPQRQAYRRVELRRWSVRLGVPLNPQPRHYPAPDGLAARMIIAADLDGVDAFGFAGAVMRAAWTEDRDIADPDTLVAIAGTLALDGRTLLARAETPETTARRETFTREAIEAQVFGAPTYVLDGELFWGQDRLDVLDDGIAARQR